MIFTLPEESPKAAKTLAANVDQLKPYYLYEYGDFCITYIVEHVISSTIELLFILTQINGLLIPNSTFGPFRYILLLLNLLHTHFYIILPSYTPRNLFFGLKVSINNLGNFQLKDLRI